MGVQWSKRWHVAVALCTAALLAGCGTPMLSGDVRGALIIVGSGAQGSAVSAWGSGWVEENNNGVSVNFSPDGQSVGMESLKAGNTYVATTDSPVKNDAVAEMTGFCGPGGAFFIPVSITPVGVAFNLAGIRGLKLDAETLAGIFNGTIKSWSDPKIVALNPGAELPRADIVPVTSSDATAVAQTASTYLSGAGSWASPVSEKWPESTAGIRVPKYGEIPKAVDDNFGSIAFLNLGDIGNRFNTLALKFDTSFASATTDPISLAVAACEVITSSHGVTLNLASSQGVGYQLGTVSYQVFCHQYPTAAMTTLVKSWAEFVTSDFGQSRSKMATGNYPPNEAALKDSRKLVATISEIR